MPEMLSKIDINLFFFLNRSFTNSFLDILMPFVTEFKNSILAIIMFSFWIIYKKRVKAIEIIIVTGIAILLSDQLSSQLVKSLFERIRPCSALDNVRVILHCNSSYSFTSSHAANTMAGSTILYFYIKRVWFVLIAGLIVLTIGFSRIYIGVHYPFDVLGGWVLGFCSSYILFKIVKKITLLKKKT